MTTEGIKTIKPSGVVARVQYQPVEIDNVDGIPIVQIEYNNVIGLPDEKPGVYYIVSAPVKNAVGNTRKDVVSVYSVQRIKGVPAYSRGCRVNG
jgi:hypothetical protein